MGIKTTFSQRLPSTAKCYSLLLPDRPTSGMFCSLSD